MVSTIVFHFVLFGVIAQRTGLGQLVIDNATILAGRYTSGPAKVSVVSSAFFGTIPGSSVANTVSTGALAQLGSPPIASHMFVLYYGVVAEITPPVCTSAYAAAAIANSNPFRTGIAAFTLGLGKVVAPMAFVYAPVLLFVSSTRLWPL